jgi:hypothetical protein
MRRLFSGLLCGGALLVLAAGCSESPKEPPPESQNAPMPKGPLKGMNSDGGRPNFTPPPQPATGPKE